MLCVLSVFTFLFGTETKAATSGTIPCSQGSVTWSLDNEGVLTFYGQGTTKLAGYEKGWSTYWSEVDLNKSAVLSVKTKLTNDTYLDTCHDMFKYFVKCTSIDLSGFRTENVSDMSGMFMRCFALEEVDLSKLNTSKVTDMSSMFVECDNIKALNVSKFDTSNVTDMSAMFFDCGELSQLDVSGFNTRNVTSMSSMFCDSGSLTELNVSGFDTSKVTNMSAMFFGCNSLTKLDVSKFDTSKVTDMSAMFKGCDLLKKLDVSKFNTSKVTDMRSMFASCELLEGLDVSKFATSEVTDMESMFSNCISLKKLDVSNFDTKKVTNVQNFIYECRALELFITPKTAFEVKLPSISSDKYWVDTKKNFYTAQTKYTFSPKTEIHRVNTSYNIIYETEGELTNCPTTYKVKQGVSQLGTVIHPHGTFLSWCLDEEGTTPVTAIEIGTFGDITLYPKLNPNTYHITYKNIEGILNKEKLPTTYTYGTKLTIPKAEKKCFALNGWFLDEACTKAFPAITKKTGGDITLYAKWEVSHDLDRQNGKVLKSATETETGLVQYNCKDCTYTLTEELPKIKTDPVEQVILNNGDNDIKGSSFAMIQARADKTTKNSVRLKWNKVNGADGYMVYGNKCGKKNKYELIKNIDNGKTTSFTHNKCKKNTYYKYTVYAYKLVNGNREKVAVSKTIHTTTKGNKYGNAKSLKVNKTKVTLKKNKTFKLKCKEVAEKGKKLKKHRAVCYESGNTQIATVTNKGVIKAKKKGTCYVYAYAQNGVYKKIKVTVK